MGARIVGIGTALPDKVLTNDDLAEMMDTSDRWIRERTGIGARRVGGLTSTMAVEAGADALDDAGLSSADVDLLVVCTTTPDQRFPAVSSTVQAGLGLGCGAFDLNAACAGFSYGLVTAHGLMALPGGPARLLLIGSDALSPITDWTDRSTAILFGDGAAAALLQRDAGGELLGFDLGADGKLGAILFCDHDGFIEMEGREVFKKAVRAVVASIDAALDRAGVTAEDLDVVLLHQANIRIIDAVCQRVGISRDKTHNVIETTGNTSAASIPLAMAEAARVGALTPGAVVLLSGFGAGMTWASVVMRW